MITVTISINGQPIHARSARNSEKNVGKQIVYITDAGEKILHNPDDGAIPLAKKMLDTIDEHMDGKIRFSVTKETEELIRKIERTPKYKISKSYKK